MFGRLTREFCPLTHELGRLTRELGRLTRELDALTLESNHLTPQSKDEFLEETAKTPSERCESEKLAPLPSKQPALPHEKPVLSFK